ncbi:sulfur carrier protein ThiS [Pantoea sp. B550]|uniref:sulfur carrier protein ThiS n=1 Tax=Pantoea TaxID=53335 RepID=UPI000E91A882|nr:MULTISPECIES: sulfur carrier protein ThiS [Pantoea]HBV89981.1 thiamine biosynthesis protein ThiS [Pantoea sp.]MCP1203998.1 sulfur carrier protein ThiS [Pantoea sp. B550]MCT2418145.1 sulfur carrier protein ThiS [Pantoea sp. XY16]NBB56549.1 sulfur carrier protein ThiS [Pantoea vagans]QZX97620.1 sulfur carrier protein ThiS [Pantoea alfalfae]
MRVQLNGRMIETSAITLAELMAEQQIDPRTVATALNGEFVPRSRYASQQLEPGSQLEILSPMQGG